jgi:hypothetical protein
MRLRWNGRSEKIVAEEMWPYFKTDQSTRRETDNDHHGHHEIEFRMVKQNERATMKVRQTMEKIESRRDNDSQSRIAHPVERGENTDGEEEPG